MGDFVTERMSEVLGAIEALDDAEMEAFRSACLESARLRIRATPAGRSDALAAVWLQLLHLSDDVAGRRRARLARVPEEE